MNRFVAAIVALSLFAQVALAQTTRPSIAQPLLQAGSRNISTHDPSSVMESDGVYWFFATGPGIRTYRSADLQTWTFGPPALNHLPLWARSYTKTQSLWAPDVVRAKDGRYLLYFSASSWGKNTSAIGLASNTTLNPGDRTYKWVDHGVVIASSAADEFNAIDPAVLIDDQKMWLTFGSFWSGIKLIELDPKTGRRLADNSPIHALAHSNQIEAPFLHRHAGKYYLFVNWGLCCRGVRSTYNIRVGRSDRITGPYLDKDGRDMLHGGGTLLLGSDKPFIGPGHAGILRAQNRDWFTCHFYDATQAGRATFAIRPLSWTKDGWPVVGADD
ncbi:MAG TPA: arabinan endo-1,5-alpha-L-arabinosidase [Tepidisphaeraceae bacterium]|jgi:arabinan endo-1,5-alpha-L-arabinosidase